MIDPDKLTAAAQADAELLQTPEAQAILRALEARLAAIPQIARLEARADRVIPGWRTSEFWMTTLGHLGLLLAMASGSLPAKYGVAAMALSQVAYSLSRGWAKNGQGN